MGSGAGVGAAAASGAGSPFFGFLPRGFLVVAVVAAAAGVAPSAAAGSVFFGFLRVPLVGFLSGVEVVAGSAVPVGAANAGVEDDTITAATRSEAQIPTTRIRHLLKGGSL